MSVLKGFFSSSLVRTALAGSIECGNARTLKTALKIKWVRPVKKPHIHPLNTGDRTSITKYDKSTPLVYFENSKELETADENVKKIFQLGLSNDLRKLPRYKKELQDKVRRHPYDYTSHEVFIATLTANIRYLQEHLQNKPKDVKNKVRLQHMIDRRKRQLTHLRRWDYPRFEWILEKLDIVYRPYPNVYDQITRKKSMIQLTTIHCEEIKEKKLAQYRKKMDMSKVPFLEKKLEKLRWIRQQEKEFQLESSVSDEEIDACERQLQAMRLEVATLQDKNYERVIHPYTLEKYDPEALLAAEKKANAESP